MGFLPVLYRLNNKRLPRGDKWDTDVTGQQVVRSLSLDPLGVTRIGP